MKTHRSLLLAPLLLCSCSLLFPSKPTAPPEYTSVKGQAVVLEIHPDLNYAILDADFGPVKVWWDQSSKFFYGPSQVQTLAIKPGDMIQFHGVMITGEIYIHQLIQPH